MNTTSVRILAAAARDIRLADCPEPVRITLQTNSRDGKIEEVAMIERQGKVLRQTQDRDED